MVRSVDIVKLNRNSLDRSQILLSQMRRNRTCFFGGLNDFCKNQIATNGNDTNLQSWQQRSIIVYGKNKNDLFTIWIIKKGRIYN